MIRIILREVREREYLNLEDNRRIKESIGGISS